MPIWDEALVKVRVLGFSLELEFSLILKSLIYGRLRFLFTFFIFTTIAFIARKKSLNRVIFTFVLLGSISTFTFIWSFIYDECVIFTIWTFVL